MFSGKTDCSRLADFDCVASGDEVASGSDFKCFLCDRLGLKFAFAFFKTVSDILSTNVLEEFDPIDELDPLDCVDFLRDVLDALALAALSESDQSECCELVCFDFGGLFDKTDCCVLAAGFGCDDFESKAFGDSNKTDGPVISSLDLDDNIRCRNSIGL